jgi:hypothetical protein
LESVAPALEFSSRPGFFAGMNQHQQKISFAVEGLDYAVERSENKAFCDHEHFFAPLGTERVSQECSWGELGVVRGFSGS